MNPNTPLLSKSRPDQFDYRSIEQDHSPPTSTNEPENASNATIRPCTPLPRVQLAILCLMRLCEPIAFTVVFPMVAFMVSEFDESLTEKEIGFYSGAIESVFAFSQLLTIMIWGKMSDRVGRKPVLILGLAGAVISTVSFGFSQSFLQMIVSRAIGGILNGNSAVVKSVMGEITTSDNQALGFSFLPLSYALGSTIGPLLGGYLSHPAERFPHSWFSRTQFWHNFPWVLPCFAASFIPLLGCVLGYIWLEETLPAKKPASEIAPPISASENGDGHITQLNADPVASNLVENAPPGIFVLLRDRNLRVILVNYSLLSFQAIALDALLVLFAYTPVRSGGIGFSAANIGVALSLSGIFTVVAQLLLFPPLQRRYGTVKLYRICMAAYPVIFLLFPLIHLIAVFEKSESHTGVWVGLTWLLLLKTSANIVFACNMILVNSAAPTHNSLGTINGIAQCCATFVRAIGPVTASSLFAFSVIHEKVAGGHMVFYVFALLSSFAYFSSLIIREGGERWRNG
ncbi:hypothetical protein CROQUDRAFT_649654 [Cronartium quercuum f. sp. fusiforme G11]|uniref:Major facilitator superfamily (MFS) profile domain-containing protein n=1 Tax=Cronartium quercuum f. sp. fusiforme G11 TaxID=708437 RepID=A0A9P6NZL0_9BASI|nr:hypothetical protein CROQUDRAFT_649654 [Cronartium quercuum f. sp. fusiforme G11]